MVLPLFKVLSIIIRVFSRPLINYTKQVHLKKDAASSHPLLRIAFIRLGNNYHKMQTWINRKFMKIQTQFAFKQLNDELAIQKGIQFFYEILFYTIVLGLPLYEMWQSSIQSKQKSQALQAKLKKIDDQLTEVLKNQQQLKTKSLQRLKQIQQQVKNKSSSQNLIKQSKQFQNVKLILPNQINHNYKIFFVPKFKYQANPQQTFQQKSNQKVNNIL